MSKKNAKVKVVETKTMKMSKAKTAKIVKVEVAAPKEDLKAIAKKRDGLIAEIVGSKLLSNEQLKRGGPDVRIKYSREVSSWNPVIAEINELGTKLGIRQTGLGHLRK